MPLRQYYRLISVVKHQTETFTKVTWEIPAYPKGYDKWINEKKHYLPNSFPAYDYTVYLRHLGFPSPLLDWTRSLYVAAYFAFRHAMDLEEKVSIYVFWEFTGRGKVWSTATPFLCSLGPYVRSHQRHFYQQSEYTICAMHEKDNEWKFVSHEEAFNRGNSEQDVLWKFNVPVTERIKVLKKLEEYNLNAFSLFGTEESLMETLAMRELSLREREI